MLHIYKALNDMAPCYISAITHLQNTDPGEYRQRLRTSSDQTRLIVSKSFKRASDMSFTIAAARLCDDLPVYLHESQSLPMFKRQLKTHLFPYFCFLFFILFLSLSAPFLVGRYINALVIINNNNNK